MSVTVIVLIVLAVLALIAVFIYNGLVRAKVRTDEAWSDITVQLKRRYDLIPNLVNTVQGYAKHEKTVFEDNQFQTALKSLFAVAEAYPDLKANQGFQQLQAELVDTEDKIQAARRFYNGAARDLNVKIQTFPTNIFAGMMGFKKRDFFDVDEGEASAVNQPVKVDFSGDSKPAAK
jgi:LemA protein